MTGLVDDMLRLARLEQHPGQQTRSTSRSGLGPPMSRGDTAGEPAAVHKSSAEDLEVWVARELLDRPKEGGCRCWARL